MDYRPVVIAKARQYGVPEDLALRVYEQETGGLKDRARAVSPAGAFGPMQLMEGTAKDLGVDRTDPIQNIDGGVRYLGQQLKAFGDPTLALAAYNAGPGAVRKYGGVPPFAETQKYVGQPSGADIFGLSPPAPTARTGGDGFEQPSGADIFGFEQPGAPAPPPTPPAPQADAIDEAFLRNDPALRTPTPQAEGRPIDDDLYAKLSGLGLDEAGIREVANADRNTFEEAYGRASTPEGKALADALRPILQPVWDRQQRESFAWQDLGREGDNAGRGTAILGGVASGYGDELLGRMAQGLTAGRNLGDRLTGKQSPYSAEDAYWAVQQGSDRVGREFTQERPVESISLSVLGGLTSPLNRVGGGYVAGARGAGQAIARAAVVGGGAGALYGSGEAGPGSRVQGAVEGAALGATTGGALQAGGSAARRLGQTLRANPSNARRISREGVQLTPGQMVGGALRRIEDGLTSVPLIGDAIRSARVRGVESFNRAALNRTLAPIGERIPRRADVGRDGLRLAETRISDAYNRALNPVSNLTPDRQLVSDLMQIAQTPNLPDSMRQSLQALMQDIQSQMTGPVNGQLWKQIDSRLATLIRSADNASQNAPEQALLRDALTARRAAHRSWLERSNPRAFEAVRNADTATANLARIRQASQYVGTSAREGLFSPSDLNRAVQGMDTSAGNRQFARGDALMQDLTDPAMAVLPSTVPDSGTPLRSLLQVGGIGLGAAGGGAAMGLPYTQEVAGLLGGAAAMGVAAYSRPAMVVANAAYRASDPAEAARLLGQLGEMAAQNPALMPLYQETKDRLSGPAGVRLQPRQGLLTAPQ